MYKNVFAKGHIINYPLTIIDGVLTATGLGFRSQENYESAVRKMLVDSEVARAEMRKIIKPVSDILELVNKNTN